MNNRAPLKRRLPENYIIISEQPCSFETTSAKELHKILKIKQNILKKILKMDPGCVILEANKHHSNIVKIRRTV